MIYNEDVMSNAGRYADGLGVETSIVESFLGMDQAQRSSDGQKLWNRESAKCRVFTALAMNDQSSIRT